MIATDRLRNLIALHEGRVPYAYQDSLGYWTIGIGHLIDRRKGGRLPEEIIDALFSHDLHAHAQPLHTALPWLERLDDVRRAVLIDMAFNLGVAGLLSFRVTLECVRVGAYSEAARNMLRSRWASQVKTRAVRLARMMQTGEWPPELADDTEP